MIDRVQFEAPFGLIGDLVDRFVLDGHLVAQVSIASISTATPLNVPRRSRRSVSWLNQP